MWFKRNYSFNVITAFNKGYPPVNILTGLFLLYRKCESEEKQLISYVSFIA